MALLKQKIGYGFGDMASSMFWKIFSYYLPVFYANIFGLTLVDAGVLVLVTRVWDAVSDPLMGIIADRTKSKWGKYRPYLLWMAAPFSICGILLFTTPDWGYGAKLIWAYVTYVLMMTVYTGINVPYGAMLGVMTDNPHEKTVFSSFRMFFAYAGSFVALFLWDPMCRWFESSAGASPATSWQLAMCVIAACCFILFMLTFRLTREYLTTTSTVSIRSDLHSLLHNKPWWILICAALCFNLFCTVRGASVTFFFSDVIGRDAHLSFGPLGNVLFYSGLFLGIGEVANMAGVALAVPLSRLMGKRNTFMAVNICLVASSVIFFMIPLNASGYWWMLLLQIFISINTGVMSPLIWAMYADVSDYSELKYHTASTGLIFSSSSMAQKFGGAIGGAAVLWLLDAAGYIQPDNPTTLDSIMAQPDSAIACLWWLMSFIPALVAALAVLVIMHYPLTTPRVNDIVKQLNVLRGGKPAADCPQRDEMTDFADTL